MNSIGTMVLIPFFIVHALGYTSNKYWIIQPIPDNLIYALHHSNLVIENIMNFIFIYNHEKLSFQY